MSSLQRISVLVFGRSSQRQAAARPRSGEAGYTMIFAVFLAATLLISLSVISLRVQTQVQREREEEMVWRGHQYERGIRRYVQKFGRYPTKIDDLVKAQSGVRYMREAYKDPMNHEDGSWRFIYVTPAGALVGSVRYTSLVQMALMDKMAQAGGGAIPGMAGMPGGIGGSSPFGNSNAFGGSSAFGGGNSAFGNQGSSFGQQTRQPGSNQGSTQQNQTQNPSGNQDNSNGNSSPNPPGTPQGNPPNGQNPGGGSSSAFGFGGANSGQSDSAFGFSSGAGGNSPLGQMGVIGGSITGVGSKVEKPSLKIYKGAKKYKEWEFIYNPIEQQAQAMGGMNGAIGTPVNQQGTGSSFGNPGGGLGSSPFSPQPPPPELPPNNPQPRNP